jgi:hypothetical protein
MPDDISSQFPASMQKTAGQGKTYGSAQNANSFRFMEARSVVETQ